MEGIVSLKGVSLRLSRLCEQISTASAKELHFHSVGQLLILPRQKFGGEKVCNFPKILLIPFPPASLLFLSLSLVNALHVKHFIHVSLAPENLSTSEFAAGETEE